MFPVRDKRGYRQEHLRKYRLVFVLFRFWFRLVYVYLICKVIIGFRCFVCSGPPLGPWDP